MTQETYRTIVIVGGGFSGTILAVNLLRRPPRQRTRIVLVEPRAQLGCGVAYAPHRFPYLLNVPAARMSAEGDDPSQFVEFARRRLPDTSAASFLPRQLYGEYLRDLLRNAQLSAPDTVHLERIQGEVTAVQPLPGARRMIARLHGRELLADELVLACGHPTPAPPAYAIDVHGHPGYVQDPYRDEAVKSSDRATLLIGTGLTMVDVAAAAGVLNPSVRLIAMSRHGLLPQTQYEMAVLPTRRGDLPSELASASLRQVVAGVRRMTQLAIQGSGDWREAISRIREIAPTLWHQLDEAQRRRFLRHVRVYWDIHRHRMPRATAERIDHMRLTGQLQVRAGHVWQLRANGDRILALWRPRGRSDIHEIRVDRVIDCTGGDHRLQRTLDPLWRQLLHAGLASADATGLGLRTGSHGELIGVDGRAADRLYYLGPMLRAVHWEATAVGELRQRAGELALRLISHESALTLSPSDQRRQISALAQIRSQSLAGIRDRQTAPKIAAAALPQRA